MLLEDRFASIRIEEVDLVVIDKQTNFITCSYLRTRVKSSNCIMPTSIEVDLKFVTQVLNNVNDCIESGGHGAIAVNKGSVFQVNRANAKGKVFIASGAGTFHEKWGNCNLPDAFEYHFCEVA